MDRFYRAYYFRPKPILRIIKTMLEDEDVLVRRCREGYEFFKSLKQRKEDLAAARSAPTAGAGPGLIVSCPEQRPACVGVNSDQGPLDARLPDDLGTATPNKSVSASFERVCPRSHSGKSLIDGNSLSGSAAAPCLISS